MKRSSANLARTLHSAASALEHGRHSTVAKKLVYLDDSDLATILAALRLFQTRYLDCDANEIRNDWDHFEDCEPLGTEDIDALCERINTTQIMVFA